MGWLWVGCVKSMVLWVTFTSYFLVGLGRLWVNIGAFLVTLGWLGCQIILVLFEDSEVFPSKRTYSSLPNNRVYLIIVFKGYAHLTCQRVVPNNRVERIFSELGQNQMVQSFFLPSITCNNQNMYSDYMNLEKFSCENHYLWRKFCSPRLPLCVFYLIRACWVEFFENNRCVFDTIIRQTRVLSLLSNNVFIIKWGK